MKLLCGGGWCGGFCVCVRGMGAEKSPIGMERRPNCVDRSGSRARCALYISFPSSLGRRAIRRHSLFCKPVGPDPGFVAFEVLTVTRDPGVREMPSRLSFSWTSMSQSHGKSSWTTMRIRRKHGAQFSSLDRRSVSTETRLQLRLLRFAKANIAQNRPIIDGCVRPSRSGMHLTTWRPRSCSYHTRTLVRLPAWH